MGPRELQTPQKLKKHPDRQFFSPGDLYPLKVCDSSSKQKLVGCWEVFWQFKLQIT